MAKIDLGLINSDGDDRPVPKEMDRHIIKFVVGRRKNAIESNPNLIKTEPWDHSDVFYAARTWLNQHKWDTSVYNDNTAGGTDRRKTFYSMIKDVCEGFYQVKRHRIGIFPEDRAVMSYRGNTYAVGFEDLDNLRHAGTDVIGVEKQGTVLKMTPFTKDNGVAFIQSQGFVSEYGIALACLTNEDYETRKDYLPPDTPRIYTSNLGNLTDCDSSGIVIGMKLKNATRLGIDLDTIDEINHINEGLEDELGIDLPIELEDVEESNEINTHWEGLHGILKGTGKLYESLSYEEREFYQEYLMSTPAILDGNTRFIEYLKYNRIELNTLLAIVKPQAFWNWLKWKMLKVWPRRNYGRGGLALVDYIKTPTMKRFIRFHHKQTADITQPRLAEERKEMREVEGIYDDIDGFRDNVSIVKQVIMGDVMNEIVLEDKQIQKIDLALEKIMQDGSRKSKSDDDNEEEEEEEEEDEEDEDE